MYSCKKFYDLLVSNEINFYAGVPDSLLKNFCSYINEHVDKSKHIITVNEGAAIALSSGYYLATKKLGLVYMQNSGQGNAINPLLSLADPLVYGIPMLLLVGWRGQPGVKDEPQHAKQGIVTLQLFETMRIKYNILSENETEKTVKELVEYSQKNNCPVALIIPKFFFSEHTSKNINKKPLYQSKIGREKAINIIIESIVDNSVIVSTTGKISRELFEVREKHQMSHDKDFLVVGSMGHASEIAHGIALMKPNKKVYCLDGDGALLMHMGNMAVIGQSCLNNYTHIVLNNGVHDSVGGQPTVGLNVSFSEIAKATGYRNVFKITEESEIFDVFKELNAVFGPNFVEIIVKPGSRSNLGRPTITPERIKENFINGLEE
jgi:phosphonopyruvate decarboxylase